MDYPTMDPLLLDIAKESRRQMSYFARRTTLHEYNGPDLACLCGISSYFLQQLAKAYYIDVKLVYGYFDDMDHCWNEHNGFIIDITATQFGVYDSVNITRFNDVDYEKKVEVIDPVTFFDEWADQSPVLYEDALQIHLDRAKDRL